MPSYDSMRAGYLNLWQKVTVTRPVDAEAAANGIFADRARYEAIEKETGVPWFWVAIVHNRESNRDFGGVLHNGERIIGTGKKTSLVPKGRGPFSSWNEAAIDALKFKELDKIRDWPVERLLYEWERYNGWGYIGKINSPYVWAGTSLQQRGKFVADGKYDASHWDTQLGCAVILKTMIQMVPGLVAGEPAIPGEVPSMTPALENFSTAELIDALIGREQGNTIIRNVMVEYSKK